MNKLSPGDKVAVVAPCGQIGSIDKIAPALDYLRNLGFVVQTGKHLLSVYRYMAGTDKQRADDINRAFADNTIKAVFCARASAGGTRILPYLDYETAKQNLKPVIGFCDNAALQLALYKKSGIISYNGFVMNYDFKSGKLAPLIADNLEKLLFGKPLHINSGTTLRSGKVSAELLCCNLSVLARMAGSSYFPDLGGKILLLEEVNEPIYKIDLMLQQLKQQPSFDKLSGLIFGQFTNCGGDAEDGTLDDCLRDFMGNSKIPAVTNFNFGHTVSRHVLPQGAKVSFDADKATLDIVC